jgi:hypothetical protein
VSEHLYLFEALLYVLLDIYPEVELLDHKAVLFLISEGTVLLFSTNNSQGIPFLHILDNLCCFVVGFFCFVFCNGCEAIANGGFDFHIPDNSDF